MSKRFRKAVVVLLCTFLCTIGSVFVANASEQRYTINEIDDMTITLPGNMSAVTRSSKNTDRYFSVFGTDYDTIMKNFKNGDIYLQGMDDASSVTVTVTMTRTDESKGIGNYSLLDPDKLSQVSTNMLSQNEYVSCTPDTAGKIVWLNFNTNVTSNGLAIKAYQANTVYDGMIVNITYQRNVGNVTAEDYEVFSGIVSSVNFLKTGSSFNWIPYIIIGAAGAVLLLIIVIAVVIRRAKKRRKRNRNDRIIEELAGKYTSKRRNNISEQPGKYDDEAYEDEEVDISSAYENRRNGGYLSNEADDDFLSGFEQSDNDNVKVYGGKDFGDDEIEEILNSKRMADEIAAQAAKESRAEVVYSGRKPIQQEKAEIEIAEEAEESSVAEQEAEPKRPRDIVSEFEDELFGKADENDDDDYNNDEELVRQEAKWTKFDDSDDFFEEAPKKVMGVISSKEIRDAEDFDVINEVEKRVSEVEKPAPKAGEAFLSVMKKIGGGIKSFGIHCGYFCTNLSRMIKRKRAIKKRKKEEELRRERARQRAERQRAQRRAQENGELVRVHSRPTQNRRPTQKRPTTPQNRSNNERRS